MFRFLIFFTIIFYFFTPRIFAHGVTVEYEYFGSDSGSIVMTANNETREDVWIDITIDGTATSGEISYWSKQADTTLAEFTRVTVNSFPTTVQAPAGANAFDLHVSDGTGVIWAVTAHSNNVNAEHVNFEVPTSDGGSGTDATNQDIVDAIDSLKPTLNVIDQSIRDNGLILSDILIKLQEILTELTTNSGDTDAILTQITPTTNFTVPSAPMTPDLNDNVPSQPDIPFSDNTTYFSDQGDAPAPGPLPSAPEPALCWEQDLVSVCQETEMIIDTELTVDTELVLDPVSVIDPVLVTDPVLSKDPILGIDPILTTDPVFGVSPELIKDPILTKDPDLIQSPVDRTLPDWTNP